MIRRQLTVSACALAGVLSACISTTAQGELIYGLTNQQTLVQFDSQTRVATSVPLTGFSASGTILTSIDVRPATGELYGLSSGGQVYKINTTTGVATTIGSPPAGISGTNKAIDFNPTVDRIRLITSSDQNFRIHPDTGAVTVDGTLAFAAGDSNFGDNAIIVNGAYTNSFAGSTATTLYALDVTNDALVTVAPPNDGVLNTVGLLGLNIGETLSFTGFDISGSSGVAYLVGSNSLGGATAPVANTLYSVNLSTGAATALGPVTGIIGGAVFRDIAVVPEPASLAAIAGAGLLLRRRRSV